MKRFVLGLGICIYLLAGGPEAADPSSRVARLSFLEGRVSFRPAGLDDWSAGTLNYPVTSGDRLWTAENSYAELHIGATAIHLSPQAAFTLSYLDDTLIQMSLSQGAVVVWIPVLNSNESAEVDTPNGAVTLSQAGLYRVDVEPDTNATSITVRTGEAEMTANGRTSRIRPGRMLQVVDNQQMADTQQAPPPDDWEQSCTARDEADQQALSDAENYVPADMDGAEDLTANGTWTNDSAYGPVWIPARVTADWAPYRNGHWVFIAPWGWTWIDDAPWGFAPFHYGRWTRLRGHWAWTPGRHRGGHPVYAPALVAFVSGNRLNDLVAKEHGPVAGWIPLGPREFYRPPYPASEGYVHRLNAAIDGKEVNTAGDYQNREQVIAVPLERMTGAMPIGAGALRVPAEAAATVRTVSIAGLYPTPESYRGRSVDERGTVAVPPEGAESRPVIVRHEIPGVMPALSAPVAGSAPAPPESHSNVSPREPVRMETAPERPVDPSREIQQRQAEQQRQIEQQRLSDQQRQLEQQREGEQQREAERQRQAEGDRQRQAEGDRQRQAEAERQRQAEAERQRQAEAERQRQAEAERQRQAEAERQRQAEEQRRAEEAKKAEDARKKGGF